MCCNFILYLYFYVETNFCDIYAVTFRKSFNNSSIDYTYCDTFLKYILFIICIFKYINNFLDILTNKYLSER